MDGPPEIGLRAFAGLVSTFETSKSIRGSLLVEICVRAIKSIINLHGREMARTQKLINEKTFSDSFIKYLNLITGASSSSEKWWNNEVRMMISERFGSCALGETEKWKLNVCMQPYLVTLISRLCNIFRIEIHRFCMNRFCEEPIHFRFEVADLIKISPRIRLNVEPTFHFATGAILKAQAEVRSKFSYRRTVLSHDPIAYWPLDESLGANHAENLGSEGSTLRARYSRAVRYHVPGFVKNDGPRHRPPVAIGFKEGAKAKIDLRAHESLCPMDISTHFSVVCWFRLDAFAPHKMICVANGRFEMYVQTAIIEFLFFLSFFLPSRGFHFYPSYSSLRCRYVSRNREMCFSVYVTSKMVSISVVSEPDVIKLDTWYFVVGTYDGGQLRLYLNGVVESRRSFTVALKEAQDEHMAQTHARQRALRDEQLIEEQGAEDYARSEIMKQIQLPSGQREMMRSAKKLMQESNLKIMISKKNRGGVERARHCEDQHEYGTGTCQGGYDQ